ncbi:hypothetical protein [Caulobacter sp. X]|uniref:hypothetical protein n=1 Tax=Caulobacter sp. X TaxID=2048901 RepID=UPI001177F6CC|nr:hypothetical protein [Caulobacter sp. X]
MPYFSAPGGGGDSVEVDSLTITAAISTGFGAGGGGSNNPMQGWHIERHPSDPGEPFVDISFKPDRQKLQRSALLAWSGKAKTN